MPDLPIDSLLKLQLHDLDHTKCQTQLASIKQSIAKQKAIIEQKQLAIQEWEAAHRQLVSQQRALEVNIQSAETKLKQLEAQKLSLQKSDALEAMETEIAHLHENISSWEDEGIDMLMAIDESEAKGKSIKAENEKVIAHTKDLIKALEEENRNAAEKLTEKQSSYEAIRSEISPRLLSLYDQFEKAPIKHPYIVPVREHKCTGCHLSVSREVEEKAIIGKELAHCEQCHRIVYAG